MPVTKLEFEESVAGSLPMSEFDESVAAAVPMPVLLAAWAGCRAGCGESFFNSTVKRSLSFVKLWLRTIFVVSV